MATTTLPTDTATSAAGGAPATSVAGGAPASTQPLSGLDPYCLQIAKGIRDYLPNGETLSALFVSCVMRLLNEGLRFSRRELEKISAFDYSYPMVSIGRLCIFLLDAQPGYLSSVFNMFCFLKDNQFLTPLNTGEEIIHAFFAAKRDGHHDIKSEIFERQIIGANEMVGCLVRSIRTDSDCKLVVDFLTMFAQIHSWPSFCRNSCLTNIVDLAKRAKIAEIKPLIFIKLLDSICYLEDEFGEKPRLAFIKQNVIPLLK